MQSSYKKLVTRNADQKLPYQDMGNTENAPTSTAGRRPFRDQTKNFNNTLASNQNEEHAVNAFDSDGLLEICAPGNISIAYICCYKQEVKKGWNFDGV